MQTEGWLEIDNTSPLPKIRARTLVAVSEKDIVVPLQFSREIAKGIILGAKLITFKNSRHSRIVRSSISLSCTKR